MRLSKLAILALKGTKQDFKEKIAEATGVTANTVYAWIQTNSEQLTLAASLRVIKEELGLSDSQLLEEITERDLKVN